MLIEEEARPTLLPRSSLDSSSLHPSSLPSTTTLKSQIYSFYSGCFFLDHSRFENELSKSYHRFCIIYYRAKIKLYNIVW